MNGSVKIDLDIDIEFSNVEKVILAIKPKWNWCDVRSKKLTAGITNKITLFYHKDDVQWNDAVLIRRYGEKTDLFLDRSVEQKNMQLLYSIGSGPELFAILNNALAYGFVNGCTPDEAMIRQPFIRELVAKEVAKLHRINLSEHPDFDTTSPVLFKMLSTFLEIIPATFTDPSKQKRWESYGHDISSLRLEVESLKTLIERISVSPLGFCHNDILLGNIIYNKQNQKITFIDYEYGGYNYLYYDIAAHFNEHAGVETIDYTLYPDRQYQKEWLTIYLLEWHRLTSNGNVAELSSLTDDMLNSVCDEVNLFSLASHLFCGLWGLVQAEHSSIDFDFIDYTFTRLNRYFQTKDKFMSPFMKHN